MSSEISSYEKLSDDQKKIIDAMFPSANARPNGVAEALANAEEAFDLAQYGRVPIDVEVVEVVQEGMGTTAILLLEWAGDSLGRYDVHLDSETLEVDRSALDNADKYPFESALVIDEAVQKHCREQLILPPLDQVRVAAWIEGNLGDRFSLEKINEGFQLKSSRGIWAKGDDLKTIVNRIDKTLVNDQQFLSEVCLSVQPPSDLKDSSGEVASRSSAFAKEKIHNAMKSRPDKFSNLENEIVSEECEETRKIRL